MKKGTRLLVRLWIPEAAQVTLGNNVPIHLPNDVEAELGREQGREAAHVWGQFPQEGTQICHPQGTPQAAEE